MLRSKRCGGWPVPNQVDERTQCRKDQDEEENPANDDVSVVWTEEEKGKAITHSWKTTMRQMAG